MPPYIAKTFYKFEPKLDFCLKIGVNGTKSEKGSNKSEGKEAQSKWMPPPPLLDPAASAALG
jgi:hypothetical protein